MKKINVFLCKMLCAMTVLSYHSPLVADSTSIRTLCPQGYYLSRCGAGVTLGTNWLKGVKKTEAGSTTTIEFDYYSYDKPTSDIIQMTNLRKFFAAQEPFTYTTATAATGSDSQQTVQPGQYKENRDQTLSYICTDNAGTLTGIECEKCPGNATVAASTVEIKEQNQTISYTSWNIHTIADCYMNEFSDETGTYVYIPNNVASGTEAAANCYYSTNVTGTNLRQE